jgi:hypothetical protein
MSEENA